MSRLVRVALGQMESRLGDVIYNIEKAEHHIAEAAGAGADIVCLPELFATGYNLKVLRKQVVDLSRDYYELTISRMSAAAEKNKIYLIAPFGVPRNDKYIYNAAILFDSKGQQVGNYYKTHTFELEKQYFFESDDYWVFDTAFAKIGILICYDVGFPEAARHLCLKGAEIIFIPSAWRIEDKNAWFLNIPSRALENQLFTVGVNSCGREGNLHLFGKSMICNPWGHKCIELDYDRETTAVCTIDLGLIGKGRQEIGYLKDRRPEIY